MTYAMGKPVLEVKADLSERLSCNSVKIHTGHIRSDLAQRNIDVRLEYICVVVDHLLCQRTDSDRSCDICGSVCELCTGVKKQESFRFHFDICLRCRLIVDYCSVRTVSGDRCKRQVEAAFLLESERFELVSNADLCQGLLVYCILEPLYKLCYSNAVLDVSFS